MAVAIYPDEFPDRQLRSFINHSSLEKYSTEAEAILKNFPEIFVPRVQYKGSGIKNTCWYLAFREKPDNRIINFTIIPSDLNIEFRSPIHLPHKDNYSMELGMQYQNNWPYFRLSVIGPNTATSILKEYIKNIKEDIDSGKCKARNRSSAECFIKKDLSKIYPKFKIRNNERPIRSPNGKLLELDLLIPDINLAIEIQGPTHYKDIYGNHKSVKQNDDFKIKWCKDNKIKLIHIEWSGYMKTIYKMPDTQRQNKLQKLITEFINSKNEYVEINEEKFRML